MSKSIRLSILILGIMLMLGSCVPIGTTIYRATNANMVFSQVISLNEEFVSEPFTIDTSQQVMVAMLIDINTRSLQEKTEYSETSYEPRYSFPVSYTILSSAGNQLASEKTGIDWKSGSKSISNQDIQSYKATITVESSFKKLKLKSPGKITIQASIGADTKYLANAESITLKVYDQVYDHTIMMSIAAVMFLVGIVMAIVGFIVTIVTFDSVVSSSDHIEVSRQAKEMAMWCHLSGMLGYFVPFGSLVVPLVLWLTQRDKYPYVDQQGREAVNFNLSVLIYGLISLVLMLLVIGFFLIFAVMLFHVVLSIIAAVKSSQGEAFRYPMILRLIK